MEIETKQAEVSSLKVLPLKASIDHESMEKLQFMDKFESIATNSEATDFISEQIEAFILTIVNKVEILYDHNVITNALQGLRMPIYVNDAEPRITLYCSEIFNPLSGIGY